MSSFGPSATPLALYSAYAAFATAVALALLIGLFGYRQRSCREPAPIRAHTIVYTWRGRLTSMAWRVLATVAGFLITRWLLLDGYADSIIRLIRAAVTKLFEIVWTLC